MIKKVSKAIIVVRRLYITFVNIHVKMSRTDIELMDELHNQETIL